jgi:hypothetical protein
LYYCDYRKSKNYVDICRKAKKEKKPGERRAEREGMIWKFEKTGDVIKKNKKYKENIFASM